MVGPRPYWLRVDSLESVNGPSKEYRLRPSLDLQSLTITSTLCIDCIIEGNGSIPDKIQYHPSVAVLNIRSVPELKYNNMYVNTTKVEV